MKDRYFLTDLILTFSLLFLVTLLLKGVLSSHQLYLILILICGFYFSWFIKDAQNQLIRFFVTASAFGILAWMINSILNSSLLYKDVIIICIKGAIFLEAILSFSVFLHRHLAYMQALSVPLFMCFPLVMKDSNGISIIAVLGYFICWLAILKVKFYEFFKKPIGEITFRRNDSIVLLVIIFLICLSVSGTLFFRYPFKQILKGGLFLEKDIDAEVSHDTLEKEYYDLQERLQKKIIELIPDFGSIENRYSILGLLSYLIKDSSTVMEVEKAEQGLISYLKTPGLGLEKGEAGAEAVTILLRNFIDKKIALTLRVIAEDMTNTLKKSPFHIKERIAIARLVDKIRHSDSIQQIAESEKQLQAVIDNSSLETAIKKELKKFMRQLKEWKIFQLQQHKVYFVAEPLLKEKAEEEAPIQQIIPPIEKEQQLVLEKYLKTQRPSSNFNISAIAGSLIRAIAKVIFLLVLCTLVLFFILYFLTKSKKDKLFSLYKDPREFIINLYGNLKELLIIFGPRHSEIIPPLSYAELVEKRYSIKDNLFLRFTAKFEEARYSQHVLRSEDVRSALNDYNNFLQILFSKHNKFTFILRYCLTLLERIPFCVS